MIVHESRSPRRRTRRTLSKSKNSRMTDNRDLGNQVNDSLIGAAPFSVERGEGSPTISLQGRPCGIRVFLCWQMVHSDNAIVEIRDKNIVNILRILIDFQKPYGNIHRSNVLIWSDRFDPIGTLVMMSTYTTPAINGLKSPYLSMTNTYPRI